MCPPANEQMKNETVHPSAACTGANIFKQAACTGAIIYRAQMFTSGLTRFFNQKQGKIFFKTKCCFLNTICFKFVAEGNKSILIK